MRAKWQADDPDAFAAQEERRSLWRRAKRGGVVAGGIWGSGGSEPSGTGFAGDGHACLPRALAVRAIHNDPAVLSDSGLLAQRARCRCVACVDTLVQQARALIMSGTHGHVFLELCCASDSELAAAVVEHSVAIQASSEDLQLVSTRRVLHRLLRFCKAYDVVVDIWVSIPCTVGASFGLKSEKPGAETSDFAITYKLVDAAVGLCRHAVRIGGGFSWEWSEGSDLWDLAVVSNLFAKCGCFTCVVSTAVVRQQFVDCEGGMFYSEKKGKL